MNESQMFFVGGFFGIVITFIGRICLYLAGRKSDSSDESGIYADSDSLNESAERIDEVAGRVESAGNSIADALAILEDAKKRAE